MKTITALAADKPGKFLAKDFRRIFGPTHDEVAERLGSLARRAPHNRQSNDPREV